MANFATDAEYMFCNPSNHHPNPLQWWAGKHTNWQSELPLEKKMLDPKSPFPYIIGLGLAGIVIATMLVAPPPACPPALVPTSTPAGNPVPQAKSDLAISWTIPESRLIVFQATTKDLADPFEKFGHILTDPKVPNEYWLSVDAFYDFEEVVSYIENYQPEE